MFFIESSRLRLIPLDHDLLKLSVTDRSLMEKTMGLELSDQVIEPLFQAEYLDAVTNFFLPQTEVNPENYVWVTNWEIVLKEENRSVGGICLAGLPMDTGETTIGYAIDKNHHRKGFATEALQCLCDWAFLYPGLKLIKASTLLLPEGSASQGVLLKAGFIKKSEDQKETHFVLTR